MYNTQLNWMSFSIAIKIKTLASRMSYTDIDLYWANKYIPTSQSTNHWARSCKNVSYAIRKQQRRSGAFASAQSDQHLCCSLLRKYYMCTCYTQSFKILASFCSWAGWFESYLVENPRRQVFAWCGSIEKELIEKVSCHYLQCVIAIFSLCQ